MGTRRSRHNKGRKRRTFRDGRQPVSDDEVLDAWTAPGVAENLPSKTSWAEFNALPEWKQTLGGLLAQPRYLGGGWLSTRTNWTESEDGALRLLIESKIAPEQAADALGRSPSSIAHRAIDGGLVVPREWKLAAGYKFAPPRPPKPPKIVRDPVAHLQYPYIIRKRDEHSDILAINDIVPKSLPASIRADICQEAMLAVLEGRTTIEVLRTKGARWFVGQFYKANFEDAGHAISLTGVNEDGEEFDRIASSIARNEWRHEQMNERRNAWDVVNHRFYAPTQVDDVYYDQVRKEQRRNHDAGLLLDYVEAEASLNSPAS